MITWYVLFVPQSTEEWWQSDQFSVMWHKPSVKSFHYVCCFSCHRWRCLKIHSDEVECHCRQTGVSFFVTETMISLNSTLHLDKNTMAVHSLQSNNWTVWNGLFILFSVFTFSFFSVLCYSISISFPFGQDFTFPFVLTDSLFFHKQIFWFPLTKITLVH